MSEYYAFLSSLTNMVTFPLRSFEAQIGIPVITALILGLIGSTSPCQLTTNVTALAYVSRPSLGKAGSRQVILAALAYLLGKVVVYSLFGIVVIVAGIKLSSVAIPVAVVVRKVVGPLLILLGLLIIGVLKPKISVGQGLSGWLEEKSKRAGRLSPFLLGAAFAFAFCPTLFWLFFGLVIPLSVTSPGGLAYPGVFALGTTLPLLAFAGLIAFGVHNINRYVRGLRRFDLYARWIVGVIFIIGGINETIIYWLW